MDDYEVFGTPIGYGSFSTVYRANHRSKSYDNNNNNDVTIAVKIAEIDRPCEKGSTDCEDRLLMYDMKRILREIELWKPLDHENLCRLLDVVVDEASGKVYFLMEYAEGGDLLTCVSERPLSEIQVRSYFNQLVGAVAYLHYHKICHGDIKLENILITGEGRIKLSDFGLARRISESKVGQIGPSCGTVEYAAPELLRGDAVDFDGLFKADIWSLGVALYAMIYRSFPFDGPTSKIMKARILSMEPKYSVQEGFEDLIDLTRKMLDKQVVNRPNIDQVLEHLKRKGIN